MHERRLKAAQVAWVQAEYVGAFHLAFLGVELLEREEASEATPRDLELQRLLTPLAKLTTGKQAVAVASEACECFGGAGYVEDTGIPRLLRDGQVLSIWEGTTNVLALDVLRAIRKIGGLGPIEDEVRECLTSARDPSLARAGQVALDALAHAKAWLMESMADPVVIEQGARRFALTLGRSVELALLVRHAQWSLDHERDARPRAAAVRLSRTPIDLITACDREALALAKDDELPFE